MKRVLLSAIIIATVLMSIQAEERAFRPVPKASDTIFWRQTVPIAMRQDYIRAAEQQTGKSWEQIPESLFGEFKANGNRVNFERESFRLRRQFATLAMGEIMEQRGRFVAELLKGLDYFTQEVWWGLPAHYPTAKPDAGNQVVDLFSAETSGMLSWAMYMLGEELELARPGVCKIVRSEIDRRMLTPALMQPYGWMKSTSNWNPWICSNWLTSVLFDEPDTERRKAAIAKIQGCLEVFVSGNPDDGGCEEGMSYWDRAAASLMECCLLMELAEGSQAFAKPEKLSRMGSFLTNMYIGNDTFVNFSDAAARMKAHPNIVYLFGRYTGNQDLMSYAAHLAKNQDFQRHPYVMYNVSGNYPTLGRELLFLSHYSEFANQQADEPKTQSSWLGNLQIATSRTQDDLFIATKGGHNGESHNHNDIGNFIVYSHATPVIIDLGAGEYTAQTFSNRRYELMFCRSGYHNVPIINGLEQHEGQQYRARKVSFKQNKRGNTFRLNLAGAYPAEANVKKWLRTIRLKEPGVVEITEKYKLSASQGETRLVMMVYGDVSQQADGMIQIKSTNGETFVLSFDAKKLKSEIERIKLTDKGLKTNWPKEKLHRISLIVNEKRLNAEIFYTLRKTN